MVNYMIHICCWCGESYCTECSDHKHQDQFCCEDCYEEAIEHEKEQKANE